MRLHGSVYTPGILAAIVDLNLDHDDIQNIVTVTEAVEGTKAYWSAGMPDDIIGFGNDCMGNMVGFKRKPRSASRPDDLPVWFFDHDFVTVKKLAGSFDRLLDWYVRNIEAI